VAGWHGSAVQAEARLGAHRCDFSALVSKSWYSCVVAEARPPMGAGDPTMYLADAARLLSITPSAIRKMVGAQRPAIRGIAPNTPLNPTGKWVVSLADVEEEARRRGRPLPQAAPPPAERIAPDSGLSTDEVRLQLLQADLVDALRAQLAEKESRIEVLERLLAEKDTRLTERDERIAALQRRVRALADVE
jgi:hypothetical protein